MAPEAPRWSSVALKHRLPLIILIGVILTGLFIYGTTKISMKVVLEDLFPFGHPFIKLHKEFGSKFGGGGTVLIALKVKQGDIFNTETLKKIKGVADAITFNNDAYSLLTASISERKMKYMRGYSGGRVEMDGLMWPKIPKTEAELEFMKENIFTNPLYNEVLVNDAGTAALIIGEFKEGIDYNKLFDFFTGLEKKYQDANTTLHMVGKPVLLGWIYSYWGQMMFVFVVSIAILVVSLYLFFGNWLGTLVPALNAVLSAVWGLGILGLLGVNLSPLLFVLVFLVGARCLGQSVQMVQRYFEELHICAGDRTIAAARTMGALLIPGLTAIIAEMFGFATCYLIKILLMQELAVALTIWMGTIFFLTGFFAPIVCSYLPTPKGKAFERFSPEFRDRQEKPGWMDRLNLKFATFAMGRAGIIIIAVYVVMYAFGFYRIPKVPIGDPTPGSPILWHDSVYNQDYDEINRTFEKAGADNYMVFFRGNEEFAAKDPRVLQTLEALDRFMASRMPDVYGGSSSLGAVVRKLNKEMHDGNPLWEFIPDNEDLCNSMLFLFQSKSVPGDLDRYADPRFYNTNILMFFKNHTEETIDRIRKNMKDFFQQYPSKLDKGEFLLAGGVIGMETAVNEEIAAQHAKLLTYVLTAIFLMCAFAYRSILAAVLLCIPLLLANILAYAFMSYAQIGFTINTLPCSAVGVGVGVDFGLFIFSRMREEMKGTGGDWGKSLVTTAHTASRGVVYTALSVILPCVAWWLLASLKFQAQMGLLLSLLLTFNMISALVLHPALIYRFKPKFIYKSVTGKEVRKN